jgi:4-hydroxybenzoate polyprenyltransferase
MYKNIQSYISLLRLDKPVGIWLLLFPTLSALVVASHEAHISINYMYICIFTLGSILMRSAGCAINDYFDKDIDAYVERTKNRPLAVQKIPAMHAVYITLVIIMLCGVASIYVFNLKTILLSILAALMAGTYPLFKRFFAIPQAYLGMAFSIGIPMAYTAQNIPISLIACLLIMANILWVIAYDTIYALVDKAYDLKIGMKTSAIFFGKFDILVIMLCYILYLVINAYIFMQLNFAGLNLGLWLPIISLVCLLIIYFYSQIKLRNPQSCLKIFKANQYVGALVCLAYCLI